MNQLLIFYDFSVFSELNSLNDAFTFKKMFQGLIINVLDFGIFEMLKEEVSDVFVL